MRATAQTSPAWRRLCIILSALVLPALSVGTRAKETTFGAKGSAWVAAAAINFDLKEVDTRGTTLVHESGWLPGIEAGLDGAVAGAGLRLHAAYYDGDTDYDGQTQSGTAINSSTDQTLWETDVTAVYRLPFGVYPQWKVYAGIGYRHWQRSIQSVGSVLGLDETYHWWTPRAGLELAWKRGRNRWVLDAALTRALDPEVKVDAFATFDSTTLALGDRWGWRSAVGWQRELSPGLILGVDMYYQVWDLGRSDPAILRSNGVPVGSVVQPQLQNRNYAMAVSLRRYW